MTQTEVMEKRWELLNQSIEEDIVLLRENGVRVWNGHIIHGIKRIGLRGNEDEGLRAADTALSLGLFVLRVSKQWPCTSGKRWKHPQMVLEIIDSNDCDGCNGVDVLDAP